MEVQGEAQGVPAIQGRHTHELLGQRERSICWHNTVTIRHPHRRTTDTPSPPPGHPAACSVICMETEAALQCVYMCVCCVCMLTTSHPEQPLFLDSSQRDHSLTTSLTWAIEYARPVGTKDILTLTSTPCLWTRLPCGTPIMNCAPKDNYSTAQIKMNERAAVV